MDGKIILVTNLNKLRYIYWRLQHMLILLYMKNIDNVIKKNDNIILDMEAPSDYFALLCTGVFTGWKYDKKEPENMS